MLQGSKEEIMQQRYGCTTYAHKGGVCIRDGAKTKRRAAATDAQIKSSMEECASGMDQRRNASHAATQWDALNMFRKQDLCMRHGAKEVCGTVGCTNQAVGRGGLCKRHGKSQ